MRLLAAVLCSLWVASDAGEQGTAIKEQAKAQVASVTREHGKAHVAGKHKHRKGHRQSPDDEDDGDDAGDGVMPPGGGGGVEGVLDAVQAQVALKSAAEQHNVIHQFMHNFATNMRYAVLEDSKGDIPEEERQRMMHAIEAERGGPPMQLEATPQAHHHHPQMLNSESRFQERFQEEEQDGERLPPARPTRHRQMLNSEFHGGPSGQMTPGAEEMQRAHAEFMHQVNRCTDADCIKRLYAMQAQRRKQLAMRLRSSGLPQPHQDNVGRAHQSSEDDDEPEAPRTVPQRDAEDDGEPEVLDADEDPTPASPPQPSSPSLKVRDAMGRTMPLLFGGQPAKQMPRSASMPKFMSATPLAFVFLTAML